MNSNSKILIETQRLYLREMTPHDAENAYLLNHDPDVIKYTGDQAFESVEEAKTFLINYDHYKKYGFGRWAVILKGEDLFLGWCGLKYNEDIDEFDIGYRFAKPHWNKGYATESALACLQFGFNNLKIQEIIARADENNHASIRVLEKIGMQYSSKIISGEKTDVIYKITSQNNLK